MLYNKQQLNIHISVFQSNSDNHLMHFLQCACLQPWWRRLHVAPVLNSNRPINTKKKKTSLIRLCCACSSSCCACSSSCISFPPRSRSCPQQLTLQCLHRGNATPGQCIQIILQVRCSD